MPRLAILIVHPCEHPTVRSGGVRRRGKKIMRKSRKSGNAWKCRLRTSGGRRGPHNQVRQSAKIGAIASCALCNFRSSEGTEGKRKRSPLSWLTKVLLDAQTASTRMNLRMNYFLNHPSDFRTPPPCWPLPKMAAPDKIFLVFLASHVSHLRLCSCLRQPPHATWQLLHSIGWLLSLTLQLNNWSSCPTITGWQLHYTTLNGIFSVWLTH